MKIIRIASLILIVFLFTKCDKKDDPPIPPVIGMASITTVAASFVSIDSAIVGGLITMNGDTARIVESGIVYDTNPNPTINSYKTIKNVDSGAFTVLLTNLNQATTYYFKAYMVSSRGITYGNSLTFKTLVKNQTDNIRFIKKLEEYYHQGNPSVTSRIRTYTFSFDNLNRLVSVGLRNYMSIGFDTATCSLFYQGNSPKPYKIITPVTSTINPVKYDTVYFTYNGSNQLVLDSSYQTTELSPTQRVPVKRVYDLSNLSVTKIEWFRPFTLNGSPELWRSDVINNQTIGMTTQFYSPGNSRGNYSKTETFTYSTYRNPLGELNISGTIFSLIYHPTNYEILGNSFHKAVYNSNILPYYLDFFSQKIPTSFYLGGFTASDFLIGAQYDHFTIAITALPGSTIYPTKIEVKGSTSYPDDSFIYLYSYQ